MSQSQAVVVGYITQTNELQLTVLLVTDDYAATVFELDELIANVASTFKLTSHGRSYGHNKKSPTFRWTFDSNDAKLLNQLSYEVAAYLRNIRRRTWFGRRAIYKVLLVEAIVPD